MQVVEREIASFRQRYPVRLTVDRDVDQQAWVFRVWDVREPDADLGLIIGDSVHNARSALDHLAYQLFIVGSGREPDEDEVKRISFSICHEPGKFVHDSKTQIRGTGERSYSSETCSAACPI